MKLIVAVLLAAPATMAAQKGLDTARIEQATGLKGEWNEKEGVFRVQVPRSDLAVSVAGTHLTPPLGLTAWARNGRSATVRAAWTTRTCPARPRSTSR